MSHNYKFPPTIFVEKNSSCVQLDHVISEFEEICDLTAPLAAAIVANDQAEIERLRMMIDLEMIDAAHSIETRLRILVKERGQVYVDSLFSRVLMKNDARKYYERKDKLQYSAPVIEEVVQHSDLLPGELEESTVPMSNADCVKVWAQLHEARTRPAFVGIPMKGKDLIADADNALYLALCKRLEVESIIVHICGTVEVLDDEDPVQKFLKGRVVETDADGVVDEAPLYQRFEEYCKAEGYRLMSRKVFTGLVSKRFPGSSRVRRGGKRCFGGLRLVDKEEATLVSE